MPFQIDDLELLKTYIEETPGISIFYMRRGNEVSIVAGQLAWKGEITNAEAIDSLEDFLTEHGAYLVKGYVSVEQIFG